MDTAGITAEMRSLVMQEDLKGEYYIIYIEMSWLHSFRHLVRIPQCKNCLPRKYIRENFSQLVSDHLEIPQEERGEDTK